MLTYMNFIAHPYFMFSHPLSGAKRNRPDEMLVWQEDQGEALTPSTRKILQSNPESLFNIPGRVFREGLNG